MSTTRWNARALHEVGRNLANAAAKGLHLFGGLVVLITSTRATSAPASAKPKARALAQTAAGTGHNCHFSVEFKLVENHREFGFER